MQVKRTGVFQQGEVVVRKHLWFVGSPVKAKTSLQQVTAYKSTFITGVTQNMSATHSISLVYSANLRPGYQIQHMISESMNGV